MDLLALVVLILGLVFLFDGEPDAWDSLRAKAMTAQCQKQAETK